MSCNKLFTMSEYDQLHAAITDIAMTVKQLRRQADENARILADMWNDLGLVKAATVPPKRVSPAIQKEAGR